MRKFDYLHLPQTLFDGKVGDVHVHLFEDKGKLETLEQLHPAVFESLTQRALVENTDASTRIEGLYVDTARVKELIFGAEFQDETEAQIKGYANALQTVQANADDFDLSTASIVALYEALFSHRDLGRKSRYRKKDYMYVQVDGHPQAMPVSPITAFETPLVLGGACDNLAEAFDVEACSPLILAGVFTVDFLCIRPFDEGNGRIARLFVDLMLQKSGFGISRYMSVDRIIEETGMEYYNALNACVDGWDVCKNDYTPYLLYWFGVLHKAYEKLFDVVNVELSAGNSKAQRVRLLAGQAKSPISKREILDALGNVSEATVEAVLGEMVKEGSLQKLGQGRSTTYLPL